MEYDLGEGVKVDILQGYGEVGGNCIVVSNKDGSVVFDQGIRFSRFKKYYSKEIEPSGPSEMLRLKIIPDVEQYTKFYISHLHLDHLGLLQTLSMGSTVYVPNLDVFNAFIEPYENTNNWTTYVSPPIGVNVDDVRGNDDRIRPLLVSHSAYPAYSLYYDTGGPRILYTGDLRLRPLLKAVDEDLFRKTHPKTLFEEYEENGYETDLLIIEGTSFSSFTTPTTPHQFIDQVTSIFQSHAGSLVFVSVDPIDLESVLSIIRLNPGRKVAVSGKRLIKMMEVWANYLGPGTEIYQLPDDELRFPVVREEEIRQSPGEYLVLTVKGEHLDLVRREELDRAPVLISLSTEAKGETGEDENVEDTWMKMLGFIVYRLRISGHYYPYELKEILETIRPKKVIPVHTEAVTAMCEYVRKLGFSCARASRKVGTGMIK
jgi:ribonuclease J